MDDKLYYVYKHITPNNKIYIGITKQNPSTRWGNGHHYKHSRYFYNAILKYGWDNIKHEILDSNLTLDQANDLEKKYIELYKTNNPNFGYNLQKGGECHIVYDTTKMQKIKNGKNKGKTVYVYNLQNEYVGEFISSYQAAKVLNCDQSHIRDCCQNKNGRKQHKSFIFKYNKEV